MKPTIRIILSCGLLCMSGLTARASLAAADAMQSDSTDIYDIFQQPTTTNYNEEDDFKNRVDFNAIDFIHQSRYRPKDKVEFSNGNFLDNFYVGVHGGINGLMHRQGPKMASRMALGVSATKFFWPWSGLRLTLNYSTLNQLEELARLTTYNVSLDHVFNISSYVSGFDPYRRWEILTTEGIGYNLSKFMGQHASAFDAHLGLQLKVNTGTRLDFFVEPRVSIFTDGIDLSGKRNWRRYDIGYGALLGATYRLGTAYENVSDERRSFLERSFFDFSSGVQTLLSSTTRGMGFTRALGNSGGIGFGTWLSESVAFRMSAFVSYNAWKHAEGTWSDQMAAYGGGRIELMLDPMAIVTHDKDHYMFSAQPFAGVEAGFALKQGGEMRRKKYVGFTGGVRLKQRLSDDLAVFVEPRYSFVPYSQYHKTIYGQSQIYDFADHLLSVNLGVEFSHGETFVGRDERNGDFIPHFTFSAGAGAAYVMPQSRSTNRRVGYTGGLGIGYLFNSVSGLRVNGEIDRIFSRQPREVRQIALVGSAVYTLDLTSLINGYDPDRRWSGELFAGPSLAAVNMRGEGQKRFYIGAEGGGRLNYHVDEGFAFYLEPKYRLFTNRVFPIGTGTPLMAQLTVGTTYHFAHRGKPLNDGEGILGDSFVGFSLGAVNNITGVGKFFKGEGRNFMNSLGPSMNIYVGRWFRPWWGYRFGMSGSFMSHGMGNGRTTDQMTAYLAASAEAMINPFNFGFIERDFKVELVPIAGLQAGRYWREDKAYGLQKGFYTALTAALQLRFNVSESFAFVIEPKGTRAIYAAGGKHGAVNDNLLSLHFGIEMSRPTRETLDRLRSEDNKFEPHFFVQAGIGGASSIAPQRYRNLNMGLEAEGAVGYQFATHSAARIGVDYAKMKPKKQNVEDMDVAYTTIELAYLWELSNSFMGYDPDRRVSVQLLAGPVFSIGGANDGKFYPGFGMGGRLGVKVSDDVEIYTQPRLRFYGKNILPASYGQSHPMMFNISIGAAYQF